MKALWVNLGTSVAMFLLGVLLTRNWGIYGLATAWSLIVSLQCIGFCACARIWVGVWTVMDLNCSRIAVTAIRSSERKS